MGDKEKEKEKDSKAAITPTIPVLRYVEEIEKKLELRKIASPAKTRPESRAYVRRSSAADKDSNTSNHNNSTHSNNNNINSNSNNNKESVSSESDTHTHTNTHTHTHAHAQQSADKDKVQQKEKEKEKSHPSASVSHTVSSAEAHKVAAQVLSLLRRLTHDSPLTHTGTHTGADALSLAQEALQRLSAVEARLRGSPALSLSLAEEVLRKLHSLCAAAAVSDAQLQGELARVRKTHAHAQGVNAAEALARESLCKAAALQVQCRVHSDTASERERLALQVLRTTQRIAGEQALLSVNGSNADALSLAREILLKTNALVAV